jgi:hypothetical protein
MGRERSVPMGKPEIATVQVSLGHAAAVLLSKGMTIAQPNPRLGHCVSAD